MKRFYSQAAAVPVAGGHGVELDGRPVKTPAMHALIVPTGALAQVLAEEWQAQGAEILPASMTLNQLANSALDTLGARRAAVVDTVSGFADADLLCYRAVHPKDLAARQGEFWGPPISWAERHFAVELVITNGIGHVAQKPEMLAAYRQAIEKLDNFQLAALHEMAVLLQSITLALALSLDHLTLAQAWQAARVDEDHQAGRWGLDAEAEARASVMQNELTAAKRFFTLLSAGN